MKISTKGRYGLRALVDMAAHMPGGPIPLAVIAARQKISLNYLEQVFGQLRKSGLVKSTKGPSGGYMLGREPEQITVKEILEVLEGPFSITDTEEMEAQDAVRQAIRRLVWNEIDRQVNSYLGKRTLAQLVQEYESLKEDQEIMYYI